MKSASEDYKPPTRRTEKLFSLKANNRDNAIPLSKTKRKVFEKSSGVYGNFVALGSIDRNLKLLEDSKNRSIAY